MAMPEFNLLDEPWILVRKNNKIEEVSLTDALLLAHTYSDLCGEIPSQDIAVLRLLLAVLHTVFSRVDETGKASRLSEAAPKKTETYRRWRALWESGHFPEAPIRDYLENYRERFWLFHETCPFWQSPGADGGTDYTCAKLNGEMSESSNKIRLFSSYAWKGKSELSYAEAARWLLHVNGYDDTSAKPKSKGLPSPGAGWLGQLGLISAVGKNLFETLMLNLVLWRDGEGPWEEEDCPIWEQPVRTQERNAISLPQNAAEILTLQSRRLLLTRRGNVVTGYALLGGDFFERVDAFTEQMTVWRRVKGKNDNVDTYVPRRHTPSRQIWRDFGAFFLGDAGDGSGVHLPGVVSWYRSLVSWMKWKNDEVCRFRTVSVHYGDKDFFVNDSFFDGLSFHATLLTELGESWQEDIKEELAKCEEAAIAIYFLADNLSKASGGDGKSGREKEQLYERFDQPFRRWLLTLRADMDGDEARNRIGEWHREAKKIAVAYGRELVRDAGSKAFIGREVKEKGKGGKEETRHYSAPEAFNWFLGKMNTIYPG